MADDQKTFTQADIDELKSDIEALKTKNNDLIREKRELQKTSAITPEQLAAVEAERDDLRAKLTTAEKDLKAAKTSEEKAVKALETESGFTQRLLVENGLREALAAQNVTNPVHQKAAMAMLAGQVQIAADGENRVAKVGDKALADFVKEWAGGEEGKHFVSAPANGGGGAHGGGGDGGKAWKDMSMTEQSRMFRENPEQARTMAKASGVELTA